MRENVFICEKCVSGTGMADMVHVRQKAGKKEKNNGQNGKKQS